MILRRVSNDAGERIAFAKLACPKTLEIKRRPRPRHRLLPGTHPAPYAARSVSGAGGRTTIVNWACTRVTMGQLVRSEGHPVARTCDRRVVPGQPAHPHWEERRPFTRTHKKDTMVRELPFVVIQAKCQRTRNPRRLDEDARTLARRARVMGRRLHADGLRPPGDRAPTKVEARGARNDGRRRGTRRDAFLSKATDDVVTDEKRKTWLSEYCAAVFTRCGSITFGENNLGRKGSDARERKVARLARSAKRTKFVRLVIHEPVRAPLPGDRNGDGSRVGFARVALLGKSMECRTYL